MAIFDIYLNLEPSYINVIKDSYKIIVVLIIFQLLIHFAGLPKNILNSALTGTALNDDFLMLLFFILIGIIAYYLIFEHICNFL